MEWDTHLLLLERRELMEVRGEEAEALQLGGDELGDRPRQTEAAQAHLQTQTKELLD